MRRIKIIWSDDTVTFTKTDSNVTKDKVISYYKIGKEFNLGKVDDYIVKVKELIFL